MNEAQLYEGLFSWLAFYTFSNFGPGEIRQNMGEIWGPRAKARLEGTTRPTILIICLEKISVSPDLLPPFFFSLSSLGGAIFIFCSQPLSLCTSSGEETWILLFFDIVVFDAQEGLICLEVDRWGWAPHIQLLQGDNIHQL